MRFVYIVIIIGMLWSIRFKMNFIHNHRQILHVSYLVVGGGGAGSGMAPSILTGGSGIMESIEISDFIGNSYKS